MRIVIVGAGFTGIQLAKLLISEKNEVAIIDNNEETMRHAANFLDCAIIHADGNNLKNLETAGISKADALVCVTNSDEVNMITCSLVDSVYPNILKIARVRNYAYYFNTASVEKIRNNAPNGNLRPLYGIDFMINPDIEAADAITQAVDTGVIGNVLSFDNSDFKIARVKIEPGSIFDGLTLKDIKTKTSKQFLLAYIEKNGETSIPKGNAVIEAGNTIGVLASKDDFKELLRLSGAEHSELRKVALIGAGKIGSIVADKIIGSNESREAQSSCYKNGKSKLSSKFAKIISSFSLKRNHDFVIIDSDEELAQAASDNFPSARVMCADATDESFLKEEGLSDFDLAICVTHNHELNMVLAAYLESIGVKQTISLVASSAFGEIASKLGVDVIVPLRDTVVDSIMSHLRGKAVKEIHTVTNGQFEIAECVVIPESKVVGKTLKELGNAGNFLVLMTKKSNEDDYKIADGNTVLSAGDNIVLITIAEDSKKILEYIGGNN